VRTRPPCALIAVEGHRTGWRPTRKITQGAGLRCSCFGAQITLLNGSRWRWFAARGLLVGAAPAACYPHDAAQQGAGEHRLDVAAAARVGEHHLTLAMPAPRDLAAANSSRSGSMGRLRIEQNSCRHLAAPLVVGLSSWLSVVVSSGLSGLSARGVRGIVVQGCFLSYLRAVFWGRCGGSALLWAAARWARGGLSVASGIGRRQLQGARRDHQPPATCRSSASTRSAAAQAAYGPAPARTAVELGGGGLPRRRRRASFHQIRPIWLAGITHIGEPLAGQQQLWPGHIGFLLPAARMPSLEHAVVDGGAGDAPTT